MKRICFIIAALVLVFGFSQCKKGNDTNPTVEGIKITLSVDEGSKADVNPGTGTVTFQNGDVIYVGSGGNYVGSLTRTSGVFTGEINDPVEGEPLYFYFLGNVTPTINGNVFTVSIADQTSSLPAISCGTSTKNYSNTITSYSSKLMNKCALVKFNVTSSSSSATCINGFNNKLSIDFSTNTTTPSKEGMGSVSLASGNGEKWAVLLPQDAITTGSAYAQDGTYTGSYGAVPAIVENGYLTSGITVTISTSNYVDLGLPSGTLWATYNIGAHVPEEYGDFFAWGETQPKSTYDWSTYKYCNGSGTTLTKYCNKTSYGYNGFTDNLTTLLPEDDAATANWGGEWCMPTDDQWNELRTNTTSIWTTLNGVNGRLFTAANGNSLFLPAAGESTIYGLYEEGNRGCYWSTLIVDFQPNSSWSGYFTQDNYYGGGNPVYRVYGLSVRAVRSSSSPNQSLEINASANPSAGGFVTGSGSYNEGQSCTLTATANSGYSFNNWTENGNQISTSPSITFTVSSSRSLVANFTFNGGGNASIGIINGLFSVSATQQVYFSQGNLQYQASTGIWKFAEHQYDYVGNDNNNISSTYSGWIDLFGWGTSGYNHGAVCFQPWSTSDNYADYYAYGNRQYHLYEQTGQADWGYNPINNGGYQIGQWRTLTAAEWAYIFNDRETTSGIRYAKAEVNGINGVIVFPDDWNSTAFSFSGINNGNVNFTSNRITESQWNSMELQGAVFLPAAGTRRGLSVDAMGGNGFYWSATNNGDRAIRVIFSSGSLNTWDSPYRDCGQSVRLVRSAE